MSGTEDAWGSVRVEQVKSAPVREGDLIAEKYIAQRTLGSGGMGVVIAAKDKVLERTVAIKFLASVATEAACERFLREAKASTRITSEHGIHLIDHGTLPNGLPFLVMEHLEGRNLKTMLEESGPLPRARAVDYVMQALQAIAEAHSKGIVHRDIKPSNLFLTQRADGTALIKVLDFGIAKIFEADITSGITGSQDTRLGSLPYMSPEQLLDPRSVDHRADIWAVGATLYELLSGKTPFATAGHYEVVHRMLNEGNHAPKLRYPELDVPSGLGRAIDRCLSPDRCRRFQDVGEMAAALAPYGSAEAQFSLTRIRGIRMPEITADSISRPVRTAASGASTRRSLAIAGLSLLLLVGIAAVIHAPGAPKVTAKESRLTSTPATTSSLAAATPAPTAPITRTPIPPDERLSGTATDEVLPIRPRTAGPKKRPPGGLVGRPVPSGPLVPASAVASGEELPDDLERAIETRHARPLPSAAQNSPRIETSSARSE